MASAPSSQISTQMVGTTIDGRFRVDALIKDSPMGAVFRATQIPIERPIILKVLHAHLWSDEGNLTRFMQEAQIISNLTHPNVVRLLDFDRRDDMLYLAMEFIDGVTLSQVIEGHRLSVPLALEFAYQICGALSESHSNDIVHRDLKPDNIMIVPMSDGTAQVKVVDFGVARALNTGKRATAAGIVCGTPAYMAPEQAQEAPVDARTDLYAVGIILYEMLCGFVPFDAETSLKVILQQIQRTPEPLSSFMNEEQMPPSLERFVLNLLAKDPDHRPRSANDVRRDIEDLMDELGTRRVRLPTQGEDLVARFDKMRQPYSEEARIELVHDARPSAAPKPQPIKLPTLAKAPAKKKRAPQASKGLVEVSVPRLSIPSPQEASSKPALGLPKLDISAALSSASAVSEAKQDEPVAPKPVEPSEPVSEETQGEGFPAGYAPAQEAEVTSDSIPQATLVGMPVLQATASAPLPEPPQLVAQEPPEEEDTEQQADVEIPSHQVPVESTVASAAVEAPLAEETPQAVMLGQSQAPGLVGDTTEREWMAQDEEGEDVAPARKPWAYVALAALVVCALGVVGVLMSGDGSPEPASDAAMAAVVEEPKLAAPTEPAARVEEPEALDLGPALVGASGRVQKASYQAERDSAQRAQALKEAAVAASAQAATPPVVRAKRAAKTPAPVKRRVTTMALKAPVPKPKPKPKLKVRRKAPSKIKDKKLKRNLDWLKKR